MKSLILLNNLKVQRRLFYQSSQKTEDLVRLSSIFGFLAICPEFFKTNFFLNYSLYSANTISSVIFFNRLSNKIYMKRDLISLLSIRFPSALFFFFKTKNSFDFSTNFTVCPPGTYKLAALLY